MKFLNTISQTSLVLSSLLSPLVFADYQADESCACDHLMQLDDWKMDGEENNVSPGDTICLAPGLRSSGARFINLTGTEESPITIKNCGGRTTFTTNHYTPAFLATQ